MPTRLHRLLALVLMFSVQFASLGVLPLECDVPGGELHRVTAGDAHGGDDMVGMAHHAVSSMKTTSLAPNSSSRHGDSSHDCAPDLGAAEPKSHPVHCELAAPCGSLLFTTAGSLPRMSVVVEHHSTMMLERVPAALPPAPDAPPPRA